MHGDFSLDPLAYRDRVSRVLAQQGRVQLDSDWNEQTESLLRFQRGMAADIIGEHGAVGREPRQSFDIMVSTDRKTVEIAWGEYYVDGIRCVNLPADDLFDTFAGLIATPPVQPPFGRGLSFNKQRDFFPKNDDSPLDGQKDELLFYLDVFERHVSSSEDSTIREVALGGPDTASRAVVVWRVRVLHDEQFKALAERLTSSRPQEGFLSRYDPNYIALNLLLRTNARLRAQAVETRATDPCTISPDARFRGVDNRLVRVEIHDPDAPSFKWSSDNGAVVYPIAAPVEGKTVHLETLGRDQRTQICVNDWVEVVDDAYFMDGPSNPLAQVVDVRRSDSTVILSEEPKNDVGEKMDRHPILRRWAAQEVKIQEAHNPRQHWFELADGIEVQFSLPKGETAGRYRRGDYWLVPARTATGDVIWPRDEADADLPAAVRPHGVGHHYAPLATVKPGATTTEDLRQKFVQLTKV
ncbi:MAG TPA: DUF6519 domain-containing protein [Thermoanaerobaculia bacterium]|nr:DUF6519 domain-containing protein [Thermoanaerobaculia bacterium]